MDRNLYKGREKWVKSHLKTLEMWVSSSLDHMYYLKIWHFEISSEVLVAFTFTALMSVASTGLRQQLWWARAEQSIGHEWTALQVQGLTTRSETAGIVTQHNCYAEG